MLKTSFTTTRTARRRLPPLPPPAATTSLISRSSRQRHHGDFGSSSSSSSSGAAAAAVACFTTTPPPPPHRRPRTTTTTRCGSAAAAASSSGRLNPDEQQQQQQQQQEKKTKSHHSARTTQSLDDCSWAWRDHYLEMSSVWDIVREEVADHSTKEPMLASFLYSTILAHASLEHSVAFVLANKLQCPVLPATQLMELFYAALVDGVGRGLLADLLATYERDPACTHYSTCLLYYKGFHAVQAHRIAHWLWGRGRKQLALVLQSRVSETMQVDIHPAAKVGIGIMLDHATGVVIGESATIGDNVSLLHSVTLGGSGKGKGKRHPSIGNGVLIGAGAVVLGDVLVGNCSKVGAGSVVLTDVPPRHVAVGVPARVFPLPKRTPEPVKTMDQITNFDFSI